jgi:hypothetical protein
MTRAGDPRDRDDTAERRDLAASDRDQDADDRDDSALQRDERAHRRDETIRDRLRAEEHRAAARGREDGRRRADPDASGALEQAVVDREMAAAAAERARGT